MAIKGMYRVGGIRTMCPNQSDYTKKIRAPKP